MSGRRTIVRAVLVSPPGAALGLMSVAAFVLSRAVVDDALAPQSPPPIGTIQVQPALIAPRSPGVAVAIGLPAVAGPGVRSVPGSTVASPIALSFVPAVSVSAPRVTLPSLPALPVTGVPLVSPAVVAKAAPAPAAALPTVSVAGTTVAKVDTSSAAHKPAAARKPADPQHHVVPPRHAPVAAAPRSDSGHTSPPARKDREDDQHGTEQRPAGDLTVAAGDDAHHDGRHAGDDTRGVGHDGPQTAATPADPAGPEHGNGNGGGGDSGKH